MSQLQDTTPHPALARIHELLNKIRVEVDALPLRYGQEHQITQGAFHRFAAAFNGVTPVSDGPACICPNGLPTYGVVIDGEFHKGEVVDGVLREA